LSPRQRALVEAVPKGAGSVADIGAGDGQVAVALAGSGARVIAVEHSAGALERLRGAAAGRFQVRAGDGLEALAPGEVEGCVIAGLGGLTIAGILQRAPEQVRALRWLVLGPHAENHRLETWLERAALLPRRVGFVVERRRLYQVIVVGR
jgi:tRNA (adenine22-N1)-methyltransferase